MKQTVFSARVRLILSAATAFLLLAGLFSCGNGKPPAVKIGRYYLNAADSQSPYIEILPGSRLAFRNFDTRELAEYLCGGLPEKGSIDYASGDFDDSYAKAIAVANGEERGFTVEEWSGIWHVSFAIDETYGINIGLQNGALALGEQKTLYTLVQS
ncbi:MAG: hypothetical protein LBQ91_06485 [Oscillospiraceae bacterium]|jgi:hypothetical protein|nr:hypothetical protein [Oscillospiraceae bacterium]